MHALDDIPGDWECLGNTTAGVMIKLRIALKPDKESSLIENLFEVSDPRHSRHAVLLTTLSLAPLLTCAAPF